jgi:uncharacterized membrane protein
MVSIEQNKTASLSNKKFAPVFILLAVLFIAARLWQLTTYPLWLDEIFSLDLARRGWGDLLRAAAQDVVHPPLFYLLLKLWIGIGGTSLIWLRLFPALTAIASMIPFYFLCREIKLRRLETNTALLLMAVNGYLIYYAQELRMYSLLLFFTLCSLWMFVRWINSVESDSRTLLCLFGVNLLLVYTQYFGWLVVGAEFIYILFGERRKLRRFFVSIALLCLCFAPWVYLVARAFAVKRGAGAQLDWLTRPHLAELLWFYATLNGAFAIPHTTVPGLLIFGSPLLWCAWRVWKRDQKLSPRLLCGLALLSFMPVLVAFSASWLLPKSVWGDRYLIIAAAPYFILIAVAVNRLRPSWVRIISLTLIVVWAVAAGLAAMRSERKIRWDMLAHTVAKDEDAPTETIKVYAFDEFVAVPLRYSLFSESGHRFEVNSVREVAALQGAHFWVAFRDTTWRGERRPQVLLTERGCQVGSETVTGTTEQKVIIFPVNCP